MYGAYGQKQGVWNNRQQKRTSTQRRKEDVRRQTPGLFSSLLFSSLLFSSLIIFSLGFSACTGNGGSTDSGGDIYTPGMGGNSGNPNATASGGSGTASTSFTAEDLLNLSNAGNADKIIKLVSQDSGSAGPETQTVTLSAADLGLPAGGTVTLLITGAVQYSRTVSADADGFVRFEVPLVETNSVVTIELSVQDSNGTVIFTGSNTQKVDGTGNLEVKLMRQFWTLPAGLTVAVSPSAIAYNNTAPDSTSVTFSITNLSGAPDGAALSYSWKDETGAEVGTGATLTRTAGQMLGASFVPLNDSETRTYSVDVSYTDASGSTVTSSGSATATIATAATLSVNATGLQTEGDRYVLAVNKGDSVSFTASILCYGGTPTYEWASSGTALGSTLTGSDTSVTSTKSANADAGGLSTVTVTAALADGRELTKYIDVYVLDLTVSEGGSLLGTSAPVFITDATGDTTSTSLTASLDGLAGLSGVSYSWQVVNTDYATVSPASGTAAATTTVSSAATGTTSVQVTASYKGVTTTPVSHPLYVVGLTVSSGGTAVTGDLAMAKDAAAKTLTAAVVNSGSITVSSSNYTWSLDGSSVTASGSGTDRSLTPAAGGKSTVTVSANVGSRTLTKTVDVYVFDIALSASATLTPSTEFVDAWYPAPDITMTTSDTAGVEVTASLNGTGMPEVEYVWMTSGTDLPIELTGTGASCTVKPRAAGMTTIKVYVKYGGSNVAYKNLHITVAGLTISGSAAHIWDDSAASHTMTLTVAPVGVPDSATVTYNIDDYSSSDTTVATAAASGSPNGSKITVTALKGGVTTITAQATYGSKILTATKEIAILKLNVTDAAGDPVPATGNRIILGGTKALTAVLEDIPAADVEYAWTSSADTKISLNPMDEADTTLTGVALGNSNITVTATYKGTATCTSPAMAFKVALGSKAAPDAVGDIVFTDGSAEPYEDGMTLTDEQKAAAIAVIFYKGTDLNNGDDTTTVRILGKGLINASSLYFVNPPSSGWATIGYIQCNATYDSFAGGYSVTGGYKNGSNALEEISRWFDDNSISNDTGNSSKYPALYWAKNYKEKLMTGETTSRLIGTDFEDGWYLPTFAEMCKFQTSTAVATKIKNAIELCGGDYFTIGSSNIYYWTACQKTSGTGYMPFRFTSLTSNGSLGGVYSGSAGDSIGACAIREF